MLAKLDNTTIELTASERRTFQKKDLLCSFTSETISKNSLIKEIDGTFHLVSARVVDEKPLPKGFYRLVDNHYVEVLFDKDGCYCLVPTQGQGYGFPIVSGETESMAILAWNGVAYRVEVNKSVDTIQLSKHYPGWPLYRVCPVKGGDLKFVGGEYQGYPLEMAVRRVLVEQFSAKINTANSESQRALLKEKYQAKSVQVDADLRLSFSNTKLAPMLDGFPW